MKLVPLAQGTGVPSNSETTTSRSITSDSRARAMAKYSGLEAPQSTGDTQVDRMNASIRKIKMRTQVSPNRHEVAQQDDSQIELAPQETIISDTNEPAVVPEETRPLSPQFAALAKHKRALQVKERELAQREEALKSQAPAGSEDLLAKLKANPLNVLQEAGVTYDQLTEAILSNQSGSNPDINSLKAELKALKEDLSNQFTTRDTQAEQQVLADIRRDIDQTVQSQPDQYEAIIKARANDEVKELIHRTWKNTGEILDVTQALELVENQLIEEALPFAQLKKVQSRLTPIQEANQQTVVAPPRPGTKIMRTLTNRDSAAPVMDKYQRAIAAMQGTLKRG